MPVKRLDLSTDQMKPELCAPIAAKATLRSLDLHMCTVGGAAGLKVRIDLRTDRLLNLLACH